MSIHNEEEADAVRIIARDSAYIGAESDGKGNWKWTDGSKWYLVPRNARGGTAGIHETKMAITNQRWHDYGNGEKKLGVVCAMPKKAVYPEGNTMA